MSPVKEKDFTMSQKGKKLEQVEALLMQILDNHKGKDQAIPASKLAKLIDRTPRRLRGLINSLIINHAIPVASCAGDGGGYYLINSKAEADEFKDAFWRRAMTGLAKAHRSVKAHFLKNSLQLTIGALIEGEKIPGADEVISGVARHMRENPELYEKEREALASEEGVLIVGREKMAQINKAARKLADLTTTG